MISDLGIILTVAGLVTLLFKKIGQPVVLGYLIAGVLVGPEVNFLPTVQDKEAIKIWAEIGVIILLFGLGLEFSFKKLAAVGRGATITALTEVVAMFSLGYFLGKAFGWKEMDSLFLGGILSISSTTIIIRAFEELGMKQRRFAQLVFGVLIVEDLVAILLLVLLSTIAVSQTFAGTQLLESTFRLGFFLTLWFVAGIFMIPWLLRQIRQWMNEETSLIVALALCFLMVILATQAGFSPALGAFIMGSILAETPDGEKIESILKPVRDLFAAIFFVSVGMLLNLNSLIEQWHFVIIITMVTVFGKILSTGLGALISGQSLKHSIQSGMSLAQIGEFSFIIATLGLTLKVTSDFLYPLAVAVSVITTFTTPYLIKSADPLYLWLTQKIPSRWIQKFDKSAVRTIENQEHQDLGSSILRLILNTILVVAIGLASTNWLEPWIATSSNNPLLAQWSALTVSLFFALPFLWAIIFKPAQQTYQLKSFEDLSQLASRAVLALVGRSLIAVLLIGFLVSQFASAFVSLIFSLALVVLLTILGFRNFTKVYSWLEHRFLSHLNEKDLEKLKTQKQKPILAPWDAHLSDFTVHPNSPAVGMDLATLAWRESLGVTIALIERGQKQIMAPRRDTLIMAYDKIFAIGTDEQLTILEKQLTTQNKTDEPLKKYGLAEMSLENKPHYIGKSIRDSGLREDTEGLVVGIERGGLRILNPDSQLVLQAEDRLWIVGNIELIQN